MTRRIGSDMRAVEIDGDDAAWLRGQSLPEGVELAELDEVEFFGAVYDRAPGSSLYVPVSDDAVDRAVSRAMAKAPVPPAPVGIDLFSGCGGFSLGMHEGGFDVVAAVEWDASAAHTYLANLGHPDARIVFASPSDEKRWQKHVALSTAKARKRDNGGSWTDFDGPWIGQYYRASRRMSGGCRAFMFGDITKIGGRQIMDAAGVDDVDCIFGGPPCQGLSTANSKACLEDPRNALIWEYMRMVAEIRPKTFLIENVPAILTVAKGALFNAIAQLANDAGYNVVAQKINAVEYGVPQHRVRAIIAGTREGMESFRYPMPTHWSLGRPIEGDGWQMIDEFDHRGHPRYQRELPAQAKYDRSARRWSFDADTQESRALHDEGSARAASADVQLDWMGGAE